MNKNNSKKIIAWLAAVFVGLGLIILLIIHLLRQTENPSPVVPTTVQNNTTTTAEADTVTIAMWEKDYAEMVNQRALPFLNLPAGHYYITLVGGKTALMYRESSTSHHMVIEDLTKAGVDIQYEPELGFGAYAILEPTDPTKVVILFDDEPGNGYAVVDVKQQKQVKLGAFGRDGYGLFMPHHEELSLHITDTCKDVFRGDWDPNTCADFANELGTTNVLTDATTTFALLPKGYTYANSCGMQQMSDAVFPIGDLQTKIDGTIQASIYSNKQPLRACNTDQTVRLAIQNVSIQLGQKNVPLPKPEITGSPSMSFGSVTTLVVGATTTYSDGLTVKLGAINDSRCPAKVQCIWQGELSPVLKLSGGEIKDMQELRLGTVRTLQASIGSYAFDLVDASTSSIKLIVSKSNSMPAQNPDDLIHVTSPLPGATVKSPLTVTGEARGSWYFEASFPIKLLDAKSTELIATPAQAQGDWMTDNFVPFKATLNFPAQPSDSTGTLILRNDNPSGLPQYQIEKRIEVKF